MLGCSSTAWHSGFVKIGQLVRKFLVWDRHTNRLTGIIVHYK